MFGCSPQPGWLFVGWLVRPWLPAGQIESYIAGLILLVGEQHPLVTLSTARAVS
jgi:hypothetical protein